MIALVWIMRVCFAVVVVCGVAIVYEVCRHWPLRMDDKARHDYYRRRDLERLEVKDADDEPAKK